MMPNTEEDKLAEAINEFDRLMGDHDELQSTDKIQDFAFADDVTLAVGSAKPDVDADDAEHGGIELVQLPAPHENDKTAEKAVVGRMASITGRTYSLVKSDLGLVVILLVYSILGAVVFHHAEYDSERRLLRQLAEHKRRCVSGIVNASAAAFAKHTRTYIDRGDWYRNLSLTVETLVNAYVDRKEQLRPIAKAPEWTYWGALFFCGTVYTTVGYGYIYPVTTAGRIITMIYALIGIPLCLVVLAGLGKSLTRAIKFLWSFIRRFYYTGSFRRVRRVIPLSRVRLTLCQRLINRLRRGMLIRRRRQTIRAARTIADSNGHGVEPTIVAAVDAELQCLRELDETFVPYEVDDKFDLPPAVAVCIAFLYILLGAFIYTRWEHWSYFEAFYFTFISLSTIGFGDVVPEHPKNLMATGVYLLLGLALIAMVVNVVMETVNSTIAKAKEGVYDVGRRIVDVAQRQTVVSLQQQGAPVIESRAPGVRAAAWPSNRRHSI